jgi:hypothetical protein
VVANDLPQLPRSHTGISKNLGGGDNVSFTITSVLHFAVAHLLIF